MTVAPNDAVAQGLWGKQGAAANPQELNRYSYVNNNPINATDPTGHFLDTILDVAFIAYGIYDIAANGYTAEKGLALAADVGGALIPGLTGAGAMVRAAAHADDIIDAGKATVNAVDAAGDAAKSFADGPRMRHYTSRNGAKAIQAEDTIKASNRQWESGCVFCEKANKKPMSQTDAEQYYGLGQGKGRDYVEFNTAPGEARSVKNPVTGRTEWVIDGDVSLAGRNSNIVKRP